MSIRIVILVLVSATTSLILPHGVNSQEKSKSNPFANDQLTALFNRRIQKDLELDDQQKEQLQEILESVKQTRDALTRKLKQEAEGVSERRAKELQADYLKEFEEIKEKAGRSATKILLPHQRQRLSEVTAQMMLSQAAKKNSLGVLAPKMIEWLEIDEEQQERLRKKADEVKADLAKKMEEIRKEAQQELLKELTPTQRKKYLKLIGDPIK